MLDRNGKPVRVGWAKHEILWLKAAMTLPRKERLAAYHDISSLTGRSLRAVRNQASRIWVEPIKAEPRHVLIPARSHIRPPRLLPSFLKQPTKQQLMGCR